MKAEYTARERFWLWVLCVFGAVGANGAFRVRNAVPGWRHGPGDGEPDRRRVHVEALVLTVVLAYLLRRWGVSGLPAGWFIVLSLIGGLAFALPLPLAVLWRPRGAGAAPRP